MSQPLLVSLDQPQVRPSSRSRHGSVAARLLHDPRRNQDVPHWARASFGLLATKSPEWLEAGVFFLVSPLDTANMTEVELTEEQEAMLSWLKTNQIQHVRVVE